MKKKFFKKRGVILVEAIIAMAVIVVVMTALVSALVSAVSSDSYSRDQTLATGYSQEGMEIVRNIKNNDFGQFLNDYGGGYYCTNGVGALSSSGSDGCLIVGDDTGKFRRVIYINQQGNDNRAGSVSKCTELSAKSVFVASTVAWASSKCSGGGNCHKVELESCITNLSYIQ